MAHDTVRAGIPNFSSKTSQFAFVMRCIVGAAGARFTPTERTPYPFFDAEIPDAIIAIPRLDPKAITPASAHVQLL